MFVDDDVFVSAKVPPLLPLSAPPLATSPAASSLVPQSATDAVTGLREILVKVDAGLKALPATAQVANQQGVVRTCSIWVGFPI